MNDCPWDTLTCAYAAGGGHFETLKWLHKNRCPWDAWFCGSVVMNNYLEVLRWLHSQECSWDKNAYSNTSWSGDVKIEDPDAFNLFLKGYDWLTINCVVEPNGFFFVDPSI